MKCLELIVYGAGQATVNQILLNHTPHRSD